MNKELLRVVENKISEARRRSNRNDPDYDERWIDVLDRLCEWRDNLLAT